MLRSSTQKVGSDEVIRPVSKVQNIVLTFLYQTHLVLVSSLATAAAASRVPPRAAPRVATTASSSSWIPSPNLLVADLGFVAVLVGRVLYNLAPAVRQQDEILSLSHVSLTLLLMAEIVA